MAEPDPLGTIVTILTNDWVAGNTDSKTPTFLKITDKKRYDYNDNQDVIFAMRPIGENEPAGIGDADKHEFDKFNLDIRVFGDDQEAHFYLVIGEVKRILKANKINPSADYMILEFDGIEQDLSNQMHKVFRKLIPVQLKRFNFSR